MTDWYRRADWDDTLEADFEARLARARPNSRAQYLSLQGYALLPNQPDKAEQLLERSVASGDSGETPRACCYLALARVAQGKIDAAIAAYDLAIEAERRNPAHRSTAAIDQALLIALFDRRDRFGDALDRLAMAVAGDWSLAGLEALAAEAIIRHRNGQAALAQGRAREALAEFPEDAEKVTWAGIGFDELRLRLEAIAE